MVEGARALTVGTCNSSNVDVDVRPLQTDIYVAVTLSANYVMVCPPGYPFRYFLTGDVTPNYPHTIASGTTIKVIRAEAAALVATGGASYA